MAWWTNPNIQIKQKNRFIMSIGEFLIPTVVSVDKPSISIESKEYTMINHVYRYPGIAKWQPITVTFVDGSGNSSKTRAGFTDGAGNSVTDGDLDIDNLDAAQMLFGILTRSGYKSGSKLSGVTSKSKMNNMSLMKSVRIEQIEPDGSTVSEGWRLHNPIFTDIKWGSLSYADDGAVEYTLTIAYDWAEFYIGGGATKGTYGVLTEKSLRKNDTGKFLGDQEEVQKEIEKFEENVQIGAVPDEDYFTKRLERKKKADEIE
jgi:hypothetical protein